MPLPRASDTNASRQAVLAPDTVARIVGEGGGAAYQWTLAADRLIWDAYAPDVLGIADLGRVACGADYAALIDPGSGRSRLEAVMSDRNADAGFGSRFETTYRLHSPDGIGEPIWLEDRGVWFAGADSTPARVEGVVRRIGLQDLGPRGQDGAARDGQAGHINRQHLAQTLSDRLADAARYRSQFGFLLIGVDHLARLNDSYGFEVGDEVVDMVGQRLRARMRAHDEIGRFSGNKFAIVLRDCSPDDMAVAAQRFISAVVDDALQTSGGAVAVSVTAGGVIAPRHARGVPEIFTHAQDALEHAKTFARGSYQSYQPSVEREAARRANLRLTDDIVTALASSRVMLAFQPIAEAASRRIVLHECLVRVEAADGGLLNGAAVVPIAEKFGLMRLVDNRVLQLALDVLASDPALRLSVNVSPSTVNDRSWLALLEERGQRGLASRLVVELTETAAIQDVEVTRRFVRRLHEIGCTVAMDDFGAGYTSFRNLRRLGVDMLKLDGSFIRALMESEDDRFFVRTLLDLARHMGMQTVAEWVPDEATAEQLAEWGCDYLQGALIALAGEGPPRQW
ncbi:MAG: diguanylate cyclase [Xanthobacteraceae bacterium]|jgi:diguanylate cyclase (GGDEF)-like protein|nr:diguanylate cyclase [Xanthobacteraceae bacterium]